MENIPKYGDIVRTGPKHKVPGRWARVLAASSDGKRVWLAVYPEGVERPKNVVRGG